MNRETGVFYRWQDYASFPVRLLVDAVDGAVFVVLCAALTVLVLLVLPDNMASLNLIFFGYCAIALIYFVILKRSGFRTLGYRAGRVRVVGLNGFAPSYWSLVVPLAFCMTGPMHWVLDLTWLFSDAHRQALHDKFAKTYVVRMGAEIAGEGVVVSRYYTICGCSYVFREVERAYGAGVAKGLPFSTR